MAFLRTGEVFKSTGKREGFWVERCEQGFTPPGWVLIDGKEVNLGKLCEPVEFFQDPPLTEGIWENYRRFLRCKDIRPPKSGGLDRLDQSIKLEELALPAHLQLDFVGACNYAHFEGDCWRCPACGYEDRDNKFLIAEQNLGRLAELTFFSPELSQASGHLKLSTGSLCMIEKEFLVGAFDIADAVIAVLGNRHWSAMWARILFSDIAVSIQQLNGGSTTSIIAREPARDVLMLWVWLESMNLAQGPGPWLWERCERVSALGGVRMAEDEDIKYIAACLRRSMDSSTKPRISLLEVKNYIVDGMVNFG